MDAEIRDINDHLILLSARLGRVEKKLGIDNADLLKTMFVPNGDVDNVPSPTAVFIPEKSNSIPEVKVEVEAQKKRSSNFELEFGLKGLGFLGILALVLGVGYFVKYAIDNNWIDHMTRIVLGVLFGSGVYALGWVAYQYATYRKWAQILIGGGLAMVYFVIYSMYQFHDYRVATGVTLLSVVMLLSVVVVIAVTTSIKLKSQTVAAGAFLLGFITSLLSQSHEVLTLVYSLLLTVGIVVVSISQKWSWLGFGGMIGSYMTYAFFADDHAPELWISAVFLGLFFGLYTASFLLIESKENKDLAVAQKAMAAVNTALLLTISYGDMEQLLPGNVGYYVMLLALLHAWIWRLAQVMKRHGLGDIYLYLAIGLFTLAAGIQYDSGIISAIWSVELLILFYASMQSHHRGLRLAVYAIAIILGLQLFFIDMPELSNWKLMINSSKAVGRAVVYLSGITTFCAIGQMVQKSKKVLFVNEHHLPLVFNWVAVLLSSLFFFQIFTGLFVSAAWVWMMLGLLYVGIYKQDWGLRVAGYVLAIVLVVNVISINLSLLEDWKVMIKTLPTILDGVLYWLIILVTYLSARLVIEAKALTADEYKLAEGFSLAGSLMAVLFFANVFGGFVLSGLWAVYGLILMMTGITLKRKLLRWQGLGLFCLTVLKVFLWDTSQLVTLYRTVSFMILGVILLIGSFLYAKYKDQLKDVL